ncbi:MAG: hypothetical protein WAU15_09365 [Nitrosomonas sp.]
MSFSEFDVTRRTWKGNFLKQIDQLIDWRALTLMQPFRINPINRAVLIQSHKSIHKPTI